MIYSGSNSSIILNINNQSRMVIYPPRPVHELCMCDGAPLILEHPELQNFTISPFSRTNPLFDMLMRIRGCLEDALEGDLRIDHIKQPIGIVRCEGLHYMLSGKSQEYDRIKSCVMAEYPRRYSTFLYEKSESFFLEISPLYPWEFFEPEPGENSYSYEEFMSTYKPILIIPIDRSALEKIHAVTTTLTDDMLARENAERVK